MLFNNFFSADPAWKTGDSRDQIALQEYFTAAFNEVEATKKYKFLSIKNPVIRHFNRHSKACVKRRENIVLLCHSLKKQQKIVGRNRKGQTSNIYVTVQKMFSIKDFFSKCDQIRSFLWIWTHSLKKSLMGNFILCAVCKELKQRRITKKIPN